MRIREAAALRMEPEKLSEARTVIRQVMAAVSLPAIRTRAEARLAFDKAIPERIAGAMSELRAAGETAKEGKPVVVLYGYSEAEPLKVLRVQPHYDGGGGDWEIASATSNGTVFTYQVGDFSDMNALVISMLEEDLASLQKKSSDTHRRKQLVDLAKDTLAGFEEAAGSTPDAEFPVEVDIDLGQINGVEVGPIRVVFRDNAPINGRYYSGRVIELDTAGIASTTDNLESKVARLTSLLEHEAIHHYQYVGGYQNTKGKWRERGMWSPAFDGYYGTADAATDEQHAAADIEFYPRIVSEVHAFFRDTEGSMKKARWWIQDRTTFRTHRKPADKIVAALLQRPEASEQPDPMRWALDEAAKNPVYRESMAKWRKAVKVFLTEVERMLEEDAKSKKAAWERVGVKWQGVGTEDMGELEPGMRVGVFGNRTFGTFSIVSLGPKGGRGKTIAYSRGPVFLDDAEFVVKKREQARVRRENKRYVHAWVAGTYSEDQTTPLDAPRPAYYNPYKVDDWVDYEDQGTVLTRAPRAMLVFDTPNAPPKVLYETATGEVEEAIIDVGNPRDARVVWDDARMLRFATTDEVEYFEKHAEKDPLIEEIRPWAGSKAKLYVTWIRKRGGDEPIEDLISLVKSFHEEVDRKRIRAPDNDINKHKNAEQLRAVVDSVVIKKRDVAKIEPAAVVNGWKLFVPTTVDEAAYVGQGTSWCTARTKGENLFYNYTLTGTSLVQIWAPDGDKYSLGFTNNRLVPSKNGGITVNAQNRMFDERSIPKEVMDKAHELITRGVPIVENILEAVRTPGGRKTLLSGFRYEPANKLVFNLNRKVDLPPETKADLNEILDHKMIEEFPNMDITDYVKIRSGFCHNPALASQLFEQLDPVVRFRVGIKSDRVVDEVIQRLSENPEYLHTAYSDYFNSSSIRDVNMRERYERAVKDAYLALPPDQKTKWRNAVGMFLSDDIRSFVQEREARVEWENAKMLRYATVDEVEYFEKHAEKDPLIEEIRPWAGSKAKLYVTWLRKRIGEEPLEDVLPLVETFHAEVEAKRIRAPDNDINRYKNPGELQRKLESMAPGRKLVEKAPDAVVEGWKLFFPKNIDEAVFVGKDTTWCTARTKGENLFYSYLLGGVTLIQTWAPNGSKYSVGYQNGQRMRGSYGGATVDQDNNGIDPERVYPPAVLQASDELGKQTPPKDDIVEKLKTPGGRVALFKGLRYQAAYGLYSGLYRRRMLNPESFEHVSEMLEETLVKEAPKATKEDAEFVLSEYNYPNGWNGDVLLPYVKRLPIVVQAPYWKQFGIEPDANQMYAAVKQLDDAAFVAFPQKALAPGLVALHKLPATQQAELSQRLLEILLRSSIREQDDVGYYAIAWMRHEDRLDLIRAGASVNQDTDLGRFFEYNRREAVMQGKSPAEVEAMFPGLSISHPGLVFQEIHTYTGTARTEIEKAVHLDYFRLLLAHPSYAPTFDGGIVRYISEVLNGRLQRDPQFEGWHCPAFDPSKYRPGEDVYDFALRMEREAPDPLGFEARVVWENTRMFRFATAEEVEFYRREAEKDPLIEEIRPWAGQKAKLYVTWLRKRIGDEPLEDVLPLVEAFHREVERKRIRGEESNINKYQNPGELQRKLESIAPAAEAVRELAPDAVVEGWKLFFPKTVDQAIFGGKGTTWCTARTKGENLFYNYALGGVTLIQTWAPNGSKYSVGYRDGQRMKGSYGGATVNAENQGFEPEEVYPPAVLAASDQLGKMPPVKDDVLQKTKTPGGRQALFKGQRYLAAYTLFRGLEKNGADREAIDDMYNILMDKLAREAPKMDAETVEAIFVQRRYPGELSDRVREIVKTVPVLTRVKARMIVDQLEFVEAVEEDPESFINVEYGLHGSGGVQSNANNVKDPALVKRMSTVMTSYLLANGDADAIARGFQHKLVRDEHVFKVTRPMLRRGDALPGYVISIVKRKLEDMVNEGWTLQEMRDATSDRFVSENLKAILYNAVNLGRLNARALSPDVLLECARLRNPPVLRGDAEILARYVDEVIAGNIKRDPQINVDWSVYAAAKRLSMSEYPEKAEAFQRAFGQRIGGGRGSVVSAAARGVVWQRV